MGLLPPCCHFVTCVQLLWIHIHALNMVVLCKGMVKCNALHCFQGLPHAITACAIFLIELHWFRIMDVIESHSLAIVQGAITPSLFLSPFFANPLTSNKFFKLTLCILSLSLNTGRTWPMSILSSIPTGSIQLLLYPMSDAENKSMSTKWKRPSVLWIGPCKKA